MAVSSTLNKVIYSCDGSQKTFPFTFAIHEEDDLTVILVSSAGVETTLTRGSGADYILQATLNDFSNGGNCITAVAYATGYQIVLVREMDLTQNVDYEEGDTFPAETHEQALDKLTMIAQQLYEVLGRGLTVPITDPDPEKLPAKTLRASKFLGFDASGDPIAVSGMQVIDSATRPYLIAAYDAPTEWKDEAQEIFTVSSSLTARLVSLLSSGIRHFRLSPGHFRANSTALVGGGAAAEIVTILGCGPSTILTREDSDPVFERNSGDWSIIGQFKIEAGSYGGYIIRGGQVGDAQETPYRDESWRNIHIVMDGGSSSDKGFYQAANLFECTVEITGGGRGFDNCRNLTHCMVTASAIDAATVLGFQGCRAMVNCEALIVGSASTRFHEGFSSCKEMSNCYAKLTVLGSVTNNAIGFEGCDRMTSCYSESDGTAASNAEGFKACERMSACEAYNWSDNGFYLCYYLSSCYAEGCGVGYNSSTYLSSCRAYNNTADGFYSSDFLTSCQSQQNGGDGFSTCDHVVCSFASTNGAYGLDGCKQCQQNWSNGNTSGQYNNSYADQSTNACADTSAGGYNR